MTAAEWDHLAASYATRSGLLPPERELLRRLRGRLDRTDMLDLGIGAGRTTEIFATVVGRYVGIDNSPAMIAEARRRVGVEDAALVDVADARDLSRWRGRSFDLVLFSFNGIDYVDGQDRERVLHEVRQVISGDGTFAFSTHSLNALPLPARPSRPSLRDPLRSTARSLRRAARIAAVNRRLDLAEARARGYVRVRDGAHNFSIMQTTYVEPAYQLRQLASAGFHVEELLDGSGASLDPLDPGPEPHLFYICSTGEPRA